MPYSIVVFLWRKPGTTPSEFKAHYETKHIPLFISLIGPFFPQTHSRVYLKRHLENGPSSDATNSEYRPTVYAGTHDDFEYDLYCTLKFEDQSKFEAFRQRMQEPEVAGKIAEDEERFLDRKRLLVAAVDEPIVTNGPPQL